jgi:hypothetical protein
MRRFSPLPREPGAHSGPHSIAGAENDWTLYEAAGHWSWASDLPTEEG